MHDLIANFLKGNYLEARRLQLYLYDIIKALFIETNPIPVKTAMAMMGMVEANMRLPLYKLSTANLDKLKEILKKYKVIND